MKELVGKILFKSKEFQDGLERERFWSRRAGAEQVMKLVIEKFGGFYPLSPGCTCYHDKEETTLYFKRVFDLAHSLGFSDEEIREGILEIENMNTRWKHASHRFEHEEQREIDPINPKDWSGHRICFSNDDAIRFLLDLLECRSK
ncbi:hypothetical protein HN958_04755 [Candidatus Falkowbacteria bacterium]|jgi:hypothetical protein|nr:hypothetical protein [Candidatus Falkowbacteria bacterium]